MKRFNVCIALALLVVLAISIPAFGQEAEVADEKTLAPYFFVHSDDPEVDRLPLQSTRADVDIAGVIARVRVTQVYKNDGKRPIEATYVFPASTRAAVFGMRMTIGERVIEARIEERQKARAEYEQARAAGKSASLLEQQRPNVFQMNVANIMPGDIITVELDYTELLVPEDGTYEFVYPTVVGPRFSTTPREGASDKEKWVENPYLREGEPEPFTFDIEVALNSGIPISRMTCISHETNIEYDGPDTAVVTLKDKKGAGTKDFVLRYNLEGERIQSGVLLYPGKDENFFLVMMEPPARVTKSVIPPREYIFVLDVSGSMNGFPLNTAKQLMRDLIDQLNETDTFNVVLFAGRAAVLSEKSLPATRENIENAMNTINQRRGGGGTRLIDALNTAFALPRQEKNVSRTTVVVTDGYVSCELEAFELIRKNLNQSNLFAFGIGSSVNRHLIEGMAHCGRGEPFVVTGPDEAKAKADRFREYIREPVLTQIEIDFKGLNAYDVEPLSVPDVLASRPVIVFGKYKGKPSGAVTISGFSGSGEYEVKLDVEPEMAKESNAALRYLWARHRIETLSDYNRLAQDSERVKEVTNLGLTYNLLTDYTSFVAVDSLVRNTEGDPTTVAQPLPLPQGVSNLAVGGAVRSVAQANVPHKLQYATEADSLRAAPSTAGKYSYAEKRKDRKVLSAPLNLLTGSRQSLSSAVGKEEHLAQAPAPVGHKATLTENERSVTMTGANGSVASGSELPLPKATPADTITHTKGDSSREPTPDAGAVADDERLFQRKVPAGDNTTVKLLVAAGCLTIVSLLLWRRHSRRKAGNNAANDEN